VKESTQRSRGTPTRHSSTPEQKLIAVLEAQVAALQGENARLLRMVEMVMEERFYRPAVTGGVRENLQTPALPLDSLSDVAVFDEQADRVQSDRENEQLRVLQDELNEIGQEHAAWRAEKGLAHAESV